MSCLFGNSTVTALGDIFANYLLCNANINYLKRKGSDRDHVAVCSLWPQYLQHLISHWDSVWYHGSASRQRLYLCYLSGQWLGSKQKHVILSKGSSEMIIFQQLSYAFLAWGRGVRSFLADLSPRFWPTDTMI